MGPYPVAQGHGVMDNLTDDTELGKLGLVLVHGSVSLGLIQSAGAEDLLNDGLLEIIRQTGTGDVHDGMAHTVTVVDDVGQQTYLSGALVAVMTLAARWGPTGS